MGLQKLVGVATSIFYTIHGTTLTVTRQKVHMNKNKWECYNLGYNAKLSRWSNETFHVSKTEFSLQKNPVFKKGLKCVPATEQSFESVLVSVWSVQLKANVTGLVVAQYFAKTNVFTCIALSLSIAHTLSFCACVCVCLRPLTHHMCKVNMWPHTHRKPLCVSESCMWRSNTGSVIWFALGSVFMFHHKTSVKPDTHTHTNTHMFPVSGCLVYVSNVCYDVCHTIEGVFSCVCMCVYSLARWCGYVCCG